MKIIQENNKSFTLIEVMIATSVLALGSVFIFESLLVSLDSYNYCNDYLNVSHAVNEKIWQAQESIAEEGNLGDIQTSGEFIEKNRRYNWDLSYGLLDEAKDKYKLFKIDLNYSWQEGRRKVHISRSAFALYEKK